MALQTLQVSNDKTSIPMQVIIPDDYQDAVRGLACFSSLVGPTVALLASRLTFLSGFGLGTLLTLAFLLFFPVDVAVALTAIVHLLNNLFTLGPRWTLC